MERDEYSRLVFSHADPVLTHDEPVLESEKRAPPALAGAAAEGLASCTRCHGAHDDGAFPRLVGQQRGYLLTSLEAFADGDRHSGVMQTVAALLTEQERESLANHFAEEEPSQVSSDGTSPAPKEQRDAILRGKEIAENGVPKLNVPSCVDCHGPGEQRLSDSYPRLSGQPARYLERQLRLFHRGQRGGGPTLL
ncbi:c-type cytochrome [Pseudobythopirellula maris]|nr:hypothetical protein [Pseudobythopirellula maris]